MLTMAPFAARRGQTAASENAVRGKNRGMQSCIRMPQGRVPIAQTASLGDAVLGIAGEQPRIRIPQSRAPPLISPKSCDPADPVRTLPEPA